MNFLCELLEASVTNLAVRGPSRGPGLGHHCLIPAGQALHSQTADHRQHWSLSLDLGTEEVCPREPSKEESEPGRDPWDPVPTIASVPRLAWLQAEPDRHIYLVTSANAWKGKRITEANPPFSLDR